MAEIAMYDIGYDLIIHDEGVGQMSAMMSQKLELYNTAFGKLVNIMEQTQSDAIMAGDLADNLQLLNTELRLLSDETIFIKKRIVEILSVYLTNIEDADGSLYADLGDFEIYGGDIVYAGYTD